MFKKVCLFSGNANPALAQNIAAYLETPLGEDRRSSASATARASVEIDENVRGVDAFVIQPTCSPVNDNVMELLIIVRRAPARLGRLASPRSFPYYGYARQDRKVAPRTPITAKLVADLSATAGVTRVVAVDLHAGQIQGFFNIPFDHLYADAGAARGLPPKKFDSTTGLRLARRRRRRARARLLQAPGRQPRHHRQAPRARERERGDAPHRRREGQGLHHPRRHDRHRRHPRRRARSAR